MSAQTGGSVAEINSIAMVVTNPSVVDLVQAANGRWVTRSERDTNTARNRNNALAIPEARPSGISSERKPTSNRFSNRWDTNPQGMAKYYADVLSPLNTPDDRLSRFSAQKRFQDQNILTYNMYGKPIQADILAMFVDLYV